MRITKKDITTISAVYFGLLLGLLLGSFFSAALAPFLSEWFKDVPWVANTFKLLITLICCYVVVSTLLQTKDEFRFIIPYIEFSKQIKGQKPLVLDTSVIIDGRIADICDTRVIDNRADRSPVRAPGAARDRRQLGQAEAESRQTRPGCPRSGCSPTRRSSCRFTRPTCPSCGRSNRVDERLVVFAKVLSARVMTNDFNLNKIAQLQGVEVINLNEVANALKTVALPGEGMNVRLVKPGDQIGQGVGYLDDGTMVVVEQGRSQIGQEVPITVTSVLQTPAGRMIFGRMGPPVRRSSEADTPC